MWVEITERLSGKTSWLVAWKRMLLKSSFWHWGCVRLRHFLAAHMLLGSLDAYLEIPSDVVLESQPPGFGS
jgi:hypothetical protein